MSQTQERPPTPRGSNGFSSEPANNLVTAPPLCVHLDGTLTPVDTLHERLIALLRQRPRYVFNIFFRLYAGTAQMKWQLAKRASFSASTLPLNQQLVDWLKLEHAKGRPLVLVTSADFDFANSVATSLGFFDEIISSDGVNYLSSENKRNALVAKFGERGFDYVGNEQADECVWRSARKGIVVRNDGEVGRVTRIVDVDHYFTKPFVTPMIWVKAVRLHQWAKNALIFLPAVLAHRILDTNVLFKCFLAFLAFGFCASSVYVVNDLLDLSADRDHPRKCKRAFASGILSVRIGFIAASALLASSIVLALVVGPIFSVVLAGYYSLTWGYSLRLKRAALVDVMTLAGLYTIRIIAGAAATSIALTFWLLAFSMFIFLSLSFVKRYTELYEARKNDPSRSRRRGYEVDDLPLLMNLGVTAGYCAVVVMALYLDSSSSQLLYNHHKPLWLICPLMLYWLSRVWLLTSRGQMPDDPVVFALRDRISLVVVAFVGLIMLISI